MSFPGGKGSTSCVAKRLPGLSCEVLNNFSFWAITASFRGVIQTIHHLENALSFI